MIAEWDDMKLTDVEPRARDRTSRARSRSTNPDAGPGTGTAAPTQDSCLWVCARSRISLVVGSSTGRRCWAPCPRRRAWRVLYRCRL